MAEERGTMNGKGGTSCYTKLVKGLEKEIDPRGSLNKILLFFGNFGPIRFLGVFIGALCGSKEA